jgi:hypothetical protein
MAEYFTTVNKKGKYCPWEHLMMWLDSKERAQNHLLPSIVSTCWEVNTVLSHEVPSCAACILFLGDKALYSHIRKLSSNKEAPYRYCCKSPWTEDCPASPTDTKCKSKDSISDTAAIVDVTPNKKKKQSTQRDNLFPRPSPHCLMLPRMQTPQITLSPRVAIC